MREIYMDEKATLTVPTIQCVVRVLCDLGSPRAVVSNWCAAASFVTSWFAECCRIHWKKSRGIALPKVMCTARSCLLQGWLTNGNALPFFGDPLVQATVEAIVVDIVLILQVNIIVACLDNLSRFCKIRRLSESSNSVHFPILKSSTNKY